MTRPEHLTPPRQRPGKRWTGLVAACVAVALIAGACGGGSSATDEDAGSSEVDDTSDLPVQEVEGDPVYGGDLVYALSTETDGWDPGAGQWAPWSLKVARSIFDTLTIFDEGGNLHPHLAESFTPSEDFTEWTVKMRPGVQFHNGQPMDAAALMGTWQYFQASPLTGRIFESMIGMEVISDLDLRVTLSEPWVNMPAAFTTQIGVVLAPESLAADPATRKNHPIGTGPFVFEEWIPDQKLVVTRNDNYWQPELPYLDSVEFRIITDKDARESSVKTGDVDMGAFDAPSEFDEKDVAGITVWKDTTTETPEQFIMLNTMKPPTDDVRVRTALALATNKDTVNRAVFDGLREVANGPYRPSSPWYAETDYPQYDPEAAKVLVDEYEAENGPINFKIWQSQANIPETTVILKEQWAAVGIDVQIDQSETASQIANVVLGNYDTLAWRQFDSPHPMQESVWWRQEEAPPLGQFGLNFARNVNPTLSAALDDARVAETFDEEYELYSIVQEELAADIPYIWLTHIEPEVAARDDVIDVLNYTIPGTDLRATSFMNSAHQMSQIWLNQ